ncbi:hypothetical protein MAQ5080_01238 [Marinomonas aquimarina]|uniref:Uncharacterized protein n=1 Tax=Marinomonas aquimarina TaxID=295068 RepID=A0A1A8T8B2_9GAMM|nr:hypothetical protein [Marinomonas aquimarina]SBS28889.1 hypothetical protein MAQ5080_01238 [Marinomonas aquimarina]
MSKLAENKEQTENSDSTEKAKRNLPIGLIVGFLICFLLSVAASAGITYSLVTSNNPTQLITEQQSEVETQLAAMRQSIEQQNATLSAINAENETLKTYLRHSSATALKNILINQEENIQAYLSVMRQAIGDLGELVPRSSDWETTYQYQMDIALKASMERTTLLNLLKTGEPPASSTSVPAQSTTSP